MGGGWYHLESKKLKGWDSHVQLGNTVYTHIYICTKLREYRDEEISQEGTVDDLSVTLTIHLLNDMKANKRKRSGVSLRDGTCSVFQVVRYSHTSIQGHSHN